MQKIIEGLITIVLLIVLAYSVYALNKWNCKRVGMDYDIFVQGCIVKGK